MFTRKILVLALLAFPGAAMAASPETPRLGQPVTELDIKPWAIDVAPNGIGLPPGRGTVAQGEALYTEKCASCHGFEGVGTPADALAGGQGTLATPKAIKTVGSYWPYAPIIFDYIRRAMPLGAPQSLTDNETYALTAYILKLNGLITDKEEMNAKSLERVQMPNRDGFVKIYPGNLK